MKLGNYEIAEDRVYYSGESIHLWVKLDGSIARIGVDDFTQKLSRGFTFLFVQKKPGDTVRQGEHIAALESAKMVLGIEAPLTGKLKQVNKKAESDAGIINKDPYGDGWLFELEIEQGSLTSQKEFTSLIQKEKLTEWFNSEKKKYGV